MADEMTVPMEPFDLVVASKGVIETIRRQVVGGNTGR